MFMHFLIVVKNIWFSLHYYIACFFLIFFFAQDFTYECKEGILHQVRSTTT